MEDKKICKVCEIEKCILDFPIYSRRCKKCVAKITYQQRKAKGIKVVQVNDKEYFKEYYIKHKAELKEKAKVTYETNKDHIIERVKNNYHKKKLEMQNLVST